MGRVKLQIKKLETAVGKQVTYSKRRTGLQKKAQELSILCDIDIVLILFSPAGKLSWTVGHKSNVEQVITRFASLSPQERAKRKLEGLEQLKRVFNKLGDDINVEEYMQLSSVSTVPVNLEELYQQLHRLRKHLALLEQRLRSYEYFNTVEEGEELERSLREQLLKIHSQKQMLKSIHQVVPFNHGISPQFYQPEEILSSEVLEGNIKGNWIPGHSEDSVLALHHESISAFPQRDTHSGAVCSSSFATSRMHFGKQSKCAEDQAKYNLYCQWKDAFLGKSYEHQNTDAQKQQRLELDMDVNHCPTSEFVSRITSSLPNNILSGSREQISWDPAQYMHCDEVINAERTRYQSAQKEQRLELDKDVENCPASEFASRNTSSLPNNIVSKGREQLCWDPSARSMPGDEAINSDPTGHQLAQYAQMEITTEGTQSCSMHHQLGLFKPQSSPVIIQNHHNSHEYSW